MLFLCFNHSTNPLATRINNIVCLDPLNLNSWILENTTQYSLEYCRILCIYSRILNLLELENKYLLYCTNSRLRNTSCTLLFKKVIKKFLFFSLLLQLCINKKNYRSSHSIWPKYPTKECASLWPSIFSLQQPEH